MTQVRPMAGHSLAMVAGEKSGDVLASTVLSGLRERGYFGSDGSAAGIGGADMAAHGFANWWHIDALSLRGYAEVIPALPRLLAMRRKLRLRILEWKPDLFIGVDAPDFNLDLEVALRAAGQKVVHFISPSIWAWRRERIEKIRRAVDRMLLVFPFEEAIYRDAGIAATFVGHPLADAIAPEVDPIAARKRLELSTDNPVIALLPGSRPDEIEQMARTWFDTARWIADREPGCQFVLPAANGALFRRLGQDLSGRAANGGPAIRLLEGRAHDALAACDTALVASGTATLEAAFFRKPLVIGYKMNRLSYRLMRGKGYLPYIGLPNILCNELLAPEFIQDAATPEALGAALLTQLNDPIATRHVQERFETLHRSMRLGCAQRVADVLLSEVGA